MVWGVCIVCGWPLRLHLWKQNPWVENPHTQTRSPKCQAILCRDFCVHGVPPLQEGVGECWSLGTLRLTVA